MLSREIGWMSLNETREFQKGYPNAKWRKTVECHPQSAVLSLSYREDTGPKRIHARFDGVVTSSYFDAQIGGVTVDGTQKRDEDVGERNYYDWSMYAYSLPDLLIPTKQIEIESRGDRNDYSFHLDEDVSLLHYEVFLERGEWSRYDSGWTEHWETTIPETGGVAKYLRSDRYRNVKILKPTA